MIEAEKGGRVAKEIIASFSVIQADDYDALIPAKKAIKMKRRQANSEGSEEIGVLHLLTRAFCGEFG